MGLAASAVGSSKKGPWPWGQMKEQRREEGVEIMTGFEGKRKKMAVENYSGLALMGVLSGE